MALHAYWTHGTVGVSTVFESAVDVELGGLSFTVPKGQLGGEGAIFFPLPTPVLVDGKRARLLRVFLLYELAAKTSIGPIGVDDGQNGVGVCAPSGSGQGLFHSIIPGPTNHTGVNCLADLIEDRTRFSLETPQSVFFGLAIGVKVRMAPDGKARFTAVGADYDI